jgi:SARP family transcriptional regulator, regulator of embCAB operon
MDIKLLGPLQAWENDQPITPTANKHRQVFALLAIRGNELVTMEELFDELWETSGPRSAAQCVQTYIMRVRQFIEAAIPEGGAVAAKTMLRTRPCGYTLHVGLDDVDVERYRALVESGERAMEAGEYAAASRIFGSALAQWRGPALVDVRIGPQLAIEAARLEQSRLSVLASRIDADLGLGRHRQLLDELAELTARYPMHEKYCAQYMTALYVCGCKWRALEIFWALRERMVNEIGLEPSFEVQRVQRAILNADPGPPEDASARAVGSNLAYLNSR